jgi:hypothetical protein
LCHVVELTGEAGCRLSCYEAIEEGIVRSGKPDDEIFHLGDPVFREPVAQSGESV